MTHNEVSVRNLSVKNKTAVRSFQLRVQCFFQSYFSISRLKEHLCVQCVQFSESHNAHQCKQSKMERISTNGKNNFSMLQVFNNIFKKAQVCHRPGSLFQLFLMSSKTIVKEQKDTFFHYSPGWGSFLIRREIVLFVYPQPQNIRFSLSL